MYRKLRKFCENEKLFSRKHVSGFRENEKHFSFFVRIDFLFFAVFRFRDLKNFCFSPFFVFKKIEVLRFRRFSISRKFRKMKNFFLKKVFRATPAPISGKVLSNLSPTLCRSIYLLSMFYKLSWGQYMSWNDQWIGIKLLLFQEFSSSFSVLTV